MIFWIFRETNKNIMFEGGRLAVSYAEEMNCIYLWLVADHFDLVMYRHKNNDKN